MRLELKKENNIEMKKNEFEEEEKPFLLLLIRLNRLEDSF